MVSVSLRCVVCGMAVVCAVLVRPVSAAQPRPTYSSAVLVSTAVMSCCCSLPGVCGVWCVVCVVFVWWGILCWLPPHSGGGVALWMVGWHGVEGRVV